MNPNALVNLLLFLCCFVLASAQNIAAAQENERDLMHSQLYQWLAETQGASPSTITMDELDGRVRIPVCEPGFTFSFPFNDGRTVRVKCDSLSWSVVMRVHFTPGRADGHNAVNSPAPAERTQISYQLIEALSAGDIVTERNIQESPPDAQSSATLRKPDRSQIVGAKLARDLASGAILQASDILPALEGLTVTRVLPRGAAINESNTRRSIFYGQLPPDALKSLDELGRMVATTQLRPGQALRFSNLRPISDVVRGDEVVLEVKRGPVTIETTVFAIEDGVVGEQIQVRSPDSNESFNVVIIGIKRASLPGEN